MLENAISLLIKAKESFHTVSIEAGLSSGNNRHYKIISDQKTYLLKHYFRDERNRMATEIQFYDHAKDTAPTQIPHLYEQDRENQLCLFEYIDGTPYKPNDITQYDIEAAISFFLALNQRETKQKNKALSRASEAFFSLSEHLSNIDTRLQALEKITVDSDETAELKKLTTDTNAVWQKEKNDAMHSILFQKYNTLLPEQHCISPSDFGFHNAIKKNNQQPVFFDFEYAGWDDPAKMIADFFGQIAVPIPPHFFERFAHKTLSIFPQSDVLYLRAQRFKTIYQFKWFCIILNIFIPAHLSRKQFAIHTDTLINIQRLQLKKAKKLLDMLYA